jgi:hypothetical protein
MQKHPFSGVVMDIAAFKVSHSVGTDIDATTLRAARARSSSIGQWNFTCMGSIRRKTHFALPRHTANSEHTIGTMERYMSGFDSAQNSPSSANTHTANSEYTIGAMKEMSRKVQNASSHIL